MNTNRLPTQHIALFSAFIAGVASLLMAFSALAAAPTISSTTPTNNATNVATTTLITATFAQDVATSSVSTSTVRLTGPGTTTVPSTVTYATSTRQVTLDPVALLLPNTIYTVTVSGVTDASSTPMSSDVVWTFTTAAAATSTPAPTIGNIMVMPSGTSSVMIAYTTSEAAKGRIWYGPTTSYGASTSLESTASTTHTVTLSNIQEATLYHYQIVVQGDGGNATSTDAFFVTQSTSSSTPLTVTSIDAVNSTATANGTFESGFKWMVHYTIPDNETYLQMRFNDFTGPSGATIPAANNIRITSAQSMNASTTASAVTSTNNGYGTALHLTGDANTTAPGRQADVLIEVSVPVGTTPGSYTTSFSTRTATTTP